MVEYTCDICSKVFTAKSRYTSHKNRKKPCKAVAVMTKKAADAFSDDDDCETLVRQTKKAVTNVSKAVTKEDAVVKPFLKWVGGKSQILTEVLSLFPKEINNYYEPFLGGGSVLLGLLSMVKEGKIAVKEKVYASDLNENLIAVYKNIQTKPREVIKEVHTLVEQFSKCKEGDAAKVNRKAVTLQEALTAPESYYFWIRSRFNSFKGADRLTCAASAMFLFMNKTCFRGLYREGPNGFNVPYGNYKMPTIIEPTHIMEISELIKDVEFSVNSFRESLAGDFTKDDFIYLDPPYAPENDKSFVSYTADGFALEDHNALFERCKEIRKDSARFVMSNADVDLVKNAFPVPTYKTNIISCRRAINSKKPGAKTNEVLISC